ncbi:hypothetical protein J7L02_02330 [Candidatus Woesearchaeota archaeon]|nr:hypothetical protein [Candidatus Woesearchaeota archaeon]
MNKHALLKLFYTTGLALSLAALLTIQGCLSTHSKGSKALSMTLIKGYPPSILYYEENPGLLQEENTFKIQLLIHNHGLSNALAGVYVTGFDPNIIDLEHSNLPDTFTVCNYLGSWKTFLNQGLGLVVDGSNFALGIQCNEHSGLTIRQTGNTFSFSGDDIEEFLGWFLGDVLGQQGFVQDFSQFFQNLCKSTAGLLCFSGIDFNCQWEGSIFNKNLKNFKCAYLRVERISEEAKMYGDDLLTIAQTMGLKLDRDGFGQQFFIKGDNPLSPGGEDVILTFDGKVKAFPPQAKSITQQFKITLLYLYSTYAYQDICVDPSPEPRLDEACKPSKSKRFKPQKAPVIVDSFEYMPGGAYDYYLLRIRNVGDGRVVNWGALESARPGIRKLLNFQDFDIVQVHDVEIAGRKLLCENQGFLRLDDSGYGEITCRLPIKDWKNRPAFNAGISVTLWYGYTQELTTSMQIYKIAKV